MNEKEFFVAVDNPVAMRRELLGTSKDIIVSLQRYERFKEIRIQKIEHTVKLKEIVSETHNLLKKLKMAMPEMEIRTRTNKETTTSSKIILPKKEAQNYMSNIQKLDSQLSDIENKLSKLK